MLYSVVVVLEPKADGTVSPTQGHHAHAAFLQLVAQADPALAEQLHGASEKKPFTVSPLQGKLPKAGNDVLLLASERYWLRFTLLDERVFATFLARMLAERGGTTIRLGRAELAVREIHTQPTTSRWAGFATFDSLLERSQPAAELALEFLSPTAFSFGERGNVLYPEPRLVFGSYLSKWNAYAESKLDKALVGILGESVRITRYQLETRVLQFARYREVGCVGVCHYEAQRGVGEESLRLMNALVDFAFFAGTGYKTTMGMGQTRRFAEGR